jgi:hypothetical protein
MHKLRQIRYAAPLLHAGLFAATWGLYAVSSEPLLNGPARWPFALLFFADLPLSAFAFGMIFTSDKQFFPALALWGVAGTVWWFLLGLSMEAWIRRFRPRKSLNASSGS